MRIADRVDCGRRLGEAASPRVVHDPVVVWPRPAAPGVCRAPFGSFFAIGRFYDGFGLSGNEEVAELPRHAHEYGAG